MWIDLWGYIKSMTKNDKVIHAKVDYKEKDCITFNGQKYLKITADELVRK